MVLWREMSEDALDSQRHDSLTVLVVVELMRVSWRSVVLVSTNDASIPHENRCSEARESKRSGRVPALLDLGWSTLPEKRRLDASEVQHSISY